MSRDMIRLPTSITQVRMTQMSIGFTFFSLIVILSKVVYVNMVTAKMLLKMTAFLRLVSRGGLSGSADTAAAC